MNEEDKCEIVSDFAPTGQARRLGWVLKLGQALDR